MLDPASGVALVLGILILLVGIAVGALVCWLLSGWLAKVPREHRKQEPGLVWLLMIPLFNLVWSFFVFPKIAQSFQSYFRSKGDTTDTGNGLALAFCILAASELLVGWIPCIGAIYSLGVLVVFILVLVKFHGLKERLVSPPMASAPPPPPPTA